MNHSHTLSEGTWMFRRSIAKHPNTPPEILELLATDDDPMVRFNVANNPNTPPEILITNETITK